MMHMRYMKLINRYIYEKLKLNRQSKIIINKSFYIDKVKSDDYLYMVYVTYNACSSKAYECKVVGDVLDDIESYQILISDVHTKKHWRNARHEIIFQKELINDDKYYGVLGESDDFPSFIVLFDSEEKAQEYITNYTKYNKKEYKPMADYLYKLKV